MYSHRDDYNKCTQHTSYINSWQYKNNSETDNVDKTSLQNNCECEFS